LLCLSQSAIHHFSRLFSSLQSSLIHLLPYTVWFEGAMGRKAGNLYINPKKLGNMAKPCMKEMVSFLNCMALNHIKDDKCEKQKQLLSVCMHGQTDNKNKSWGNINYHLQRLTRGRK
ncbi:hypothetical protein CARUB_v10010688mg, partial [Capsella rubella]